MVPLISNDYFVTSDLLFGDNIKMSFANTLEMHFEKENKITNYLQMELRLLL